MKKLFSQSKRNLGAMPGAVIHIGESRTEKISIELIDYSESDVEDRIVDNLVDLDRFKKTPSDSWININGIHDTGVVSKIGELFLIHPLVQEDIVNTTQRPKLEDYDNYLFIVLKMLTFNEKLDEIESEQVSVILGEKYLITFQEKEGDVFDFVRDRIKNNKGRIRRMGMDFLAYSLIDAIVDHYFAILERIGDKIDILDDTLIEDSEQINVHEIHKLKKNILMLRKAIWPLRELLNNFQKVESKLISDKLDLFLRDVYDHTIQIMDTVDT
ncbi:magnesium and cobalt transport protein CorA, partial [bacterium]|nr:magnesium and cobalt transport protein CorA [bacterium]